MSRRARAVTLTAAMRCVLERLSRARKQPQHVVERASMIVLAADGVSDAEQARQLGTDPQRPRRWRARWLREMAAVVAVEESGAPERELEAVILRTLTDEPRSGGPPKFSAEQVTKLIALACETPADSGLPVNRWTPAELATEAVKRGIVESISARHLDRILKRG